MAARERQLEEGSIAFNIRLNVIETEGRAAPAIAAAPTSVAGLLHCGGRRRNPTHLPVCQGLVARRPALCQTRATRESLWNKIKYNTVTPFLLRLYQEGAFGPGTPADVFTVVCSPENNPPEEIVLGNLQVEVYFFPSRPAETIMIIVGQQESGATASKR
jgi:hypothetical protein